MDRSVKIYLPMVDIAWPGTDLRREVVLILAGCLLIVISAQIHIPLKPVPITGQTFGVLLVGALLGSRRGALSMLTYLSWGIAGLPVFAGGGVGLTWLIGPTGGYLVGFVAAAFLVGWLSERGWDRRKGKTAQAMLLGSLTIYVFGATWLARFVGWGGALELGIKPFLLGDVLKITLAALALPWGWSVIGAKATDTAT
jgi:biotin transport system substrate-specific component